MDLTINVSDDGSLQVTEEAAKPPLLNVLSRSHSASSLLPHYFPDDIIIELPIERFETESNLAWSEHNPSSLLSDEIAFDQSYVGNHMCNNVQLCPHSEPVAKKVKTIEYPGLESSDLYNRKDCKVDPKVSRKAGSKAEGIRGNYKCGKCGHQKLDQFGRPHNCQFVGSSLAPLLISLVTDASTNIICPHCKLGFTLVGSTSTVSETAESTGSTCQNTHEPFLSALGPTKPTKTWPHDDTFTLTSNSFSRDCPILEPSERKPIDTSTEKALLGQEYFVLEQSLVHKAESLCEAVHNFQSKKDVFAASAARSTSSCCNLKVSNPLEKLTSGDKLDITDHHKMATDNENQNNETLNKKDTPNVDCNVVSRVSHDHDRQTLVQLNNDKSPPRARI